MHLLKTAHELEAHSLLAADDELGSMVGLYFDETTWDIRYLIVNAGGRLTDDCVLIAPVAIGGVDEKEKNILIELTRKQIENSPPVRITSGSLSRQYETAYYQYFDWTPYWEMDSLSDSSLAEMAMTQPPVPQAFAMPATQETRLHSTAKVNGFATEARDGEIGHVDDFIVDTQYWVVRYLEIDTRNRLPGEHALINPGWIKEISWTDRAISVDMTREAIKSTPHIDLHKAISRDYEEQLFKHYGSPVYWCHGAGRG